MLLVSHPQIDVDRNKFPKWIIKDSAQYLNRVIFMKKSGKRRADIWKFEMFIIMKIQICIKLTVSGIYRPFL